MTAALVDEFTVKGALYYCPCGEDVVEVVATEAQSVKMLYKVMMRMNVSLTFEITPTTSMKVKVMMKCYR